MMDEFVTVPLQDGESALPIARVSVSHVAFASMVVSDHPVVHLDDSSHFEVVPLRVSDSPRTSIFGI